MNETNRYKKFKIIIVDPSIIFSDGLERFLNADPECTVIGRFTEINSITGKVWQSKPDVILFNPIIISSHKRFIIKSLFKEYPEAVIIALLYNYVTPDILSAFDEIIDIFEKPEKVLRKIKSTIEKSVSQTENEQNSNDGIDLSDREKEILISVAQGLTNKEIAEKHNISIHTVVSHRKNISRKTNIRTVSGLTVYAMLNNLLP